MHGTNSLISDATAPTQQDDPIRDEVNRRVAELDEALIEFRRDLHAHPEVGHQEFRTTGQIMSALERAGLAPEVLAMGTGVQVDVLPPGHDGTDLLALRADIDALPITESAEVAYASQNPGVCHACGHDVHTTAAVGAAVVLAGLRDEGQLERGVRVIFQPAEEVQPGGAEQVIAGGALDGVTEVYALHCDPKVEVGRIGLKVGALTSAADQIVVRATGSGGHTSRPHLTQDLVGALGALACEAPLLLSRRIDPRGGVSLIWGRIRAGAAPNAVPGEGEIAGTLRALDPAGWEAAGALLPELLEQIVAPYGVQIEVEHERGVPPTINHASGIDRFRASALRMLGPDSTEPTEQSLGGEDFAWMVRRVPGALARLGVRTPGVDSFADIHQPNFTVDERAIGVAVRLLVGLATATTDTLDLTGPPEPN
ncbi:amidohydrolase [Propionibacteriaceae bacterium Y1685]